MQTRDIIEAEQASGGELVGIVVSLGGQTPLKLANQLPPELVLGTAPGSIDAAEDRRKFEDLTVRLGITTPEAGTATSLAEAMHEASLAVDKRALNYPN